MLDYFPNPNDGFSGPSGCTFTPGDGTGGPEAWVGDVESAAACGELVHSTEPTANGATYSSDGGTDCYAEFGMTGPDDKHMPGTPTDLSCE